MPAQRTDSILKPFHVFLAFCFGLMLAACAGPTVESLRDPVPEPLVSRTVVPGYAHIRYWGDNGEGVTSGKESWIRWNGTRWEWIGGDCE